MIERYTRPAMGKILGRRKQIRIWLEIEITCKRSTGRTRGKFRKEAAKGDSTKKRF